MLNCCEHMFCFECILEWAKVTNRCPLCKAKFNTVTPRALKEGAGKPHKRSVYRVLDREQRVEWEPEEGELYDDDELGEDEGDEDSFIVPDDEAEEEDRIWRPRRAAAEEEDEEEEAVLTDDSGDGWGDDLSDASFGTVDSLRPIRAAPPRSRRAAKPPARPPPAAAAAARSPMRRYLPPAPSRAAPAPSVTPLPANAPGPKPPPRPASAKQRVVDRVEIVTPDGRTLSVRRSKYSATPAPPRPADTDAWSLLDRLRTGGAGAGAGGGAGGVAAKPEAVRRPNKRRGGASSHALIAHAMPRLTFQRTASTQSNGSVSSTASVAPLSRASASAPALPPSQPPPLPPLSRSATVPAAPPPPPSTPPQQLVRSGLSSSFGSTAAPTLLVPATPQGASAQSVSAPAPPAAAASSSSPLAIAATPPARATPVSSPFRGDRQERAALKHTVAERAKQVLTPIYRRDRISLVQFKVIARAATESFMEEEGRGADLREHLRRAVERELGVTLESLEFKPEKTKRTD